MNTRGFLNPLLILVLALGIAAWFILSQVVPMEIVVSGGTSNPVIFSSDCKTAKATIEIERTGMMEGEAYCWWVSAEPKKCVWGGNNYELSQFTYDYGLINEYTVLRHSGSRVLFNGQAAPFTTSNVYPYYNDYLKKTYACVRLTGNDKNGLYRVKFTVVWKNSLLPTSSAPADTNVNAPLNAEVDAIVGRPFNFFERFWLWIKNFFGGL